MSSALRRYYRGHSLVTMRDVQANASRHYHFDHQGTTQCLTDSSAAVTDRFSCDAWGVAAKKAGASINQNWYVGNCGYTQHHSQACYVRARHCNPGWGSWFSADPDDTLGIQPRERHSVRKRSGATGPWRLPRAQLNPCGPNRRGSTADLRYAYAGNQPSFSVDPSGRSTIAYGDCPQSRGGNCPCQQYPNKSCRDVCGEAEATIGRNIGGTPVCGYGRFCFCVWSPSGPGGCSDVTICYAIHEATHCDHSYCDQCAGGLRGSAFHLTFPPAMGECMAYRAMYDCLNKTRDTIRGECVEYLDHVTDTVLAAMIRYCELEPWGPPLIWPR